MVSANEGQWGPVAAGAVAIVAAVILGLQLRLEDPLSSPVIPAEDPYTHMALVREHVRDGELEPLHEGGRLYPPGMHAFLSAAWIYTGADLYQLMRLAPAFFGALGVVGIGLLLWRWEGPLAAGVGAIAWAVVPEAVFRTTMMSPTAVDLAVLPFLLYALLEVATGRLAWTAPLAVIGAFLLFSHPWLLTILALSGVVFTAAALALPWPSSRGPPLTPAGLAAATATLGSCWGLALWGCNGACGPGFEGILPQADLLRALAPMVLAGSLASAAVLVAARRPLGRFLRREVSEPRLTPARANLSLGLAILVAAATAPALRAGLPDFVNFGVMFGWPVVVLAALAFVAWPFLPGPAAHAGAALAAATYGFVIYNPFNSPFWPHRTAVYLGFGLAILAAAGTGLAARSAARAIARGPSRSRRPLGARAFVAAALGLLVATSMAGAVYTATPEPKSWYRLFTPCEMDALGVVASDAAAKPNAVVITGSWQSKLVVAALSTDASRIWYSPSFFTSAKERDGVVGWLGGQHRPLVVVVDVYLKKDHPEADTQFLAASPWRAHGSWCPMGEKGLPGLTAYITGG